MIDLIGDGKILNHKPQHNNRQGTQSQAHSFSYQTSKVTYGGVDGAYYTSTRTRSTGADGVSSLSKV